jgi:hypothetical protein
LNKDIDWAIKQVAPHTCKHVLLILANRADKKHQCFPSLFSIATDTGMTRRSVMRCVITLEALGLILRKQRGTDSTLYTLMVGTQSHHLTKDSQLRKVRTECHHQQGQTVPSDTPSLGTQSHLTRDRVSPSLGTQSHMEPKIETKLNPKQGDLRKRTRAPDSISITESMREWAAKNKVVANLEIETEAMLDYHRGKGNLQSDWVATWRTWMRNSIKFNRNRGNENGNHKESRLEKEDRALQEFINRSVAPEVFTDISDVRIKPK